MDRIEGKSVRDAGGQLGHVAEVRGDRALLRLAGGKTVVIDSGALIAEGDGFYLPFAFDKAAAQLEGAEDQVVVPVVEETLEVGKRRVDRGGVRLRKSVSEHEEVIDEPLLEEEVEVERHTVGRVLEEPVGVRQEGDTTIYPVLEEVLVVEKRLMLKEEVRVTKRRTERREPQRVTLRRESVSVEDDRAEAQGDEPKKSG